MFEDNWFLFILVIMLLFSADGGINTTENAVLLAIVFALALTAGCGDSDSGNCFCNRTLPTSS